MRLCLSSFINHDNHQLMAVAAAKLVGIAKIFIITLVPTCRTKLAWSETLSRGDSHCDLINLLGRFFLSLDVAVHSGACIFYLRDDKSSGYIVCMLLYNPLCHIVALFTRCGAS